MKYRRLLIMICLLGTSSVLAQTANVIELSPNDAARAQKAWDTLQKAQAEWKAVRSDIEKSYVKRACLVIGCTSTSVEGFESDFEFSKDFKVIVPKAATWITTGGSGTIVPSYPCYPGWNWTPCMGANCGIKYN